MTNFGWEYVWHCHILGHEENDMMRALVLKGNDRIGIFRGNGQWWLDMNGNNIWDPGTGADEIKNFGSSGNIPVSGDWTGDGTTKPGVFFGNGTWWLDLNNNGVLACRRNIQVWRHG